MRAQTELAQNAHEQRRRSDAVHVVIAADCDFFAAVDGADDAVGGLFEIGDAERIRDVRKLGREKFFRVGNTPVAGLHEHGGDRREQPKLLLDVVKRGCVRLCVNPFHRGAGKN